jgi:hypothetical protein
MVSQHSDVELQQKKKEKFEANCSFCSKDIEQYHLWVTEWSMLKHSDQSSS